MSINNLLWNLLTTFWPVWLIFLVLVVVGVLVLLFLPRRADLDLSVFIKRKFLFDNKTEHQLFQILVELFGDKYYIFPQVSYSHLLEARKELDYRERFRYWNMINRKSADFVLCDKVQVVPQLVIELDGDSHLAPKRMERDGFINELVRTTDLKLLHILPKDLSKESIQRRVLSALEPSSQKGSNLVP